MSLRTKDIELAKEMARKIYYQMMGQIELGRRIFSVSMGELVEKYMEHQQQRVDTGFIVQGRHTQIRTQLKHLLSFVGEGSKLDTIRSSKYRHYYTFRKKHHPEVKDPTLINERATIGNLHKWVMEQGVRRQMIWDA